MVAPDLDALKHFECKPAPEKVGYELVKTQVEYQRRLEKLQQLQQLQQQLEMLKAQRSFGKPSPGPGSNLSRSCCVNCRL